MCKSLATRERPGFLWHFYDSVVVRWLYDFTQIINLSQTGLSENRATPTYFLPPLNVSDDRVSVDIHGYPKPIGWSSDHKCPHSNGHSLEVNPLYPPNLQTQISNQMLLGGTTMGGSFTKQRAIANLRSPSHDPGRCNPYVWPPPIPHILWHTQVRADG